VTPSPVVDRDVRLAMSRPARPSSTTTTTTTVDTDERANENGP